MRKFFFWFINPLTKWLFLSPVFVRHFTSPNNTYLNNYITLYAWVLFIYVIVYGIVLAASSGDLSKLSQKDILNMKARESCPKSIYLFFNYVHLIVLFCLALIGEWGIFFWNALYTIELAIASNYWKNMLKKYQEAGIDSAKRQKKIGTDIEDGEFEEVE